VRERSLPMTLTLPSVIRMNYQQTEEASAVFISWSKSGEAGVWPSKSSDRPRVYRETWAPERAALPSRGRNRIAPLSREAGF
jgi:hypothetical protein